MNDEIRAAVERLFAICLDVTLAGTYHAHMSYAAHTGEVTTYLCPASTKYQAKYSYLINESIYIHHPTLTSGDAVGQINALIGRLNGYLQEDAA